MGVPTAGSLGGAPLRPTPVASGLILPVQNARCAAAPCVTRAPRCLMDTSYVSRIAQPSSGELRAPPTMH